MGSTLALLKFLNRNPDRNHIHRLQAVDPDKVTITSTIMIMIMKRILTQTSSETFLAGTRRAFQLPVAAPCLRCKPSRLSSQWRNWSRNSAAFS